MLRIGLECKVFCYDGISGPMAEIGVDIPLSSCVLRSYVFYGVNYVTECIEDSRYSIIGVNGEEFVVNESCYELRCRLESLSVIGYN